MRLYFDTACIAKCYLNEPDGKAVAEMACVFQRQIREDRLSRDQASEWRGTYVSGPAMPLIL